MKKRNKFFRKIKYYLHRFQHDCPKCQSGIVKLESLDIERDKPIYKCSWCGSEYIAL